MKVFKQPNGRWRAEPSNRKAYPYIVGYGETRAKAIADKKAKTAKRYPIARAPFWSLLPYVLLGFAFTILAIAIAAQAWPGANI